MASSSKPDKTQKVLALCGIAAPILFTILVAVASALRPGYSQVAQYISELGQVGTSNAFIQDANFVVTGVLLIAFFVGLYRSIGPGSVSKIALGLLLVFPVAMVLAGTIFPLPSPIHFAIAAPAFILLVVAIFPFWRALTKDSQWQGYARYTLATGVVSVGLLLFLIATSQAALAAYAGLGQRLFIAPIFVWFEVLAARLFVLSGRPTA